MFRFTIRELVLLTLVVALGVGWRVDRGRLDGPLARLAEYQLAEQRALKHLRDEKRLQELTWKLHSIKAVNEYGAPAPKRMKDRPALTMEEFRELFELSEALGRESDDAGSAYAELILKKEAD